LKKKVIEEKEKRKQANAGEDLGW